MSPPPPRRPAGVISGVQARAGVMLEKLGVTSAPQDRTKASGQLPAQDQGKAEIRTQIDTYFTKMPSLGAQPEIIYNGDRQWAKVTLELETAGPVAVGTMAKISPVLSGKGQLLTTNEPKQFTVAKGTRLYIVATGVNRVKRTIEPLPWLEQIVGLVTNVAAQLKMAIRGKS